MTQTTAIQTSKAVPRPSENRWSPNPLRDEACAAIESCHFEPETGHWRLPPGMTSGAEESAIHDRLKSKILDQGFPCVAARSVINRKSYRLGVYPSLGTADAALAICHDLYEFSHALRHSQAPFTSFIAAFKNPVCLTEAQFEALLWKQLQLIHEVDVRYFEWDAAVSKDPDDAKFSFSVGGRAFFVIGLHQASSRLARTVHQPCLVFNPHEQFEALRVNGGYEKLKTAIRQRDMAYQGSVNPVLTDFGQQTEARQYSGRPVPSEWKCPFHNHHQQQEVL